jgi:hypothetical protein
MPKDDWAKYRSRDLGRKAARNGTALRNPKPPTKRRRKRKGFTSTRREPFVSPLEWLRKIEQANTHGQLDAIGRDLIQVRQYLKPRDFSMIVTAGIKQRRTIPDNHVAYAGATQGH